MISVLYVDDETALLDVTKLFLERSGDFTVDTAESARSALEKLKTTRYDAIVSDYQMPGMDGIEFLKVLRKEYPTLPFIIFTGKGREEVVIQAFESGADFYLQKGGAPKPQFTELARKITSVVEQRKSAARVITLNRLYTVLSSTNHAIIHRQNVKELLDEVCRIAVDIGGFRMAWAGRVNQETHIIEPFVSCGFVDGYFEKNIISADAGPTGEGPTGTAFREGRYNISNDLATDPRMGPWREEALKRGYRAIASFPFAVNTRYAGTLTLYAPEPGFFDDEIVKLLDEMASDITFALRSLEAEEQQKAAEEKIRRDEEKFRNIFDAAPNLIVSINRSAIIVDCNRRIVDTLGYRKEEVVGKPVSLIIQHDSQVRATGFLSEIKSDGTLHTTTLMMVKKDGTEIDVSINSGGLKDRSGIIFRTVWIVEDITRHLRTEEDLVRKSENLDTAYQDLALIQAELRKNFESLKNHECALEDCEVRYRELTGRIRSGMVVFEPRENGEDFRVKEINRSAEELCGLRHPEAIGKSVHEIFTGARGTGFFAALQEVFRTGKQATFTPVLSPDGCLCRISTAVIYRLPSGEVVAILEIPAS
jgi:PAS domain S-box-containing protein